MSDTDKPLPPVATAAPVPDPDQAAAQSLTGAHQSEATAGTHIDHAAGPAAALDHAAHLDTVPKANVTPERVAAITTTQDHAPAPGVGDSDRPLEPELEDLGWSQDPKRPLPVLHGLKNESLWLLVRRFNKQTYRVKKVDRTDATGLDCYISHDEQFSPDKLKSTLERLYISVVVGVVAAFKHVARIRSWTEPRRTAGFCAYYSLAWLTSMVMPAMFLLMLVLILSPRARILLFPPAPLAAIDAKTGKARIPKAGHLGSKHSLTGAAETYEGEAVEQEASNLIGALGSVAVSTAAGKSADTSAIDDLDSDDSDAEADGDDAERAKAKAARAKSKKDQEKVPDPTSIAAVSHAAQSKASGEKTGHVDAGDHTKKPMEDAIFASLAPFMHILNNVADDWERLGNALSPTPPFNRWMPRFRLAGAVAPLLLASMFVTENMIYRGASLGFGVAMFGQPIFDRVPIAKLIEWLDRNVPDWKKYLELRFMLLRGVPTNAQLNVTLLRIGEANKSPLPPPPPSSVAPPPDALHGSDMADHPDLPPEYSEQLAEEHVDAVASRPEGEDKSATDTKKKPSKILSILKGTAKAGAEVALGANRVKASAGSLTAKTKLGVVRGEAAARKTASDGPVSFAARYKGKKGHVYISTSATTPCVSFERDGDTPNPAKAAAAAAASSDPVENAKKLVNRPTAKFSIAIEDIVELRKVGGLGWKGKLIVGWALGSEVADGLEIVDKLGKVWRVTAMGRRDEVFNRLLSIGSQRWEIY
ncbi:uncharacterized protein PFL1_04109 [Pseudozyma flocculosa PF-1]|uniref:Uncharacterized protein n=2 Tax=Pseudozyma flocculosa TaxID=84751 RepID=A0A5C3EV44_9BASI|nr:uncharacterized protein PFL1_04109 [Pseudozyma flocculosa PF-1]EPQ28282.1 hypothetical protein PFL1_04109 [Pseudozyma flocculosa PF-1]SPO35426.1 uncharacterized protein PSFLO_00897 [Pseudozyma flocculosa]